MRRRFFWIAIAVIGSAGCSRGAAAPRPPPSEPPQEMTWTTQLDRAHPLVGRVWDCRRAVFVEPDAALETVGAARVVLLGEKHDNPDHHRLQARVVQSIVARGRHP